MRLFLCEKPSQGKDIAAVLGATQRGDGCLRGPGVVVTWAIGHLIEAAPPDAYGEHYKSWTVEALPIIPPQWKVDVKPKTAGQFKIVKALLKDATEVVIATDADREGEMIACELLELCNYRRGPIFRLWLSALNDASIRQALSNLRPAAATYPMYQSALARSRADWLIGMNFTRLFTLLGRRAGYSGVLSVGRVQTPTLRLVADRDREISDFRPVPFWNLEVQLLANGQPFMATWIPDSSSADEEGRCLDQRIAQATLSRLAIGSTAVTLSVDTKRTKEPAPLPFDLGSLQVACSRKFGLGAQETLNVAQALYETHKATTYPRTNCGYLPVSMLAEVPAVLDAVRKTDPSITSVLQQLNPSRRSRAWNDAKITAHHGIIPTLEAANLSAMSATERHVYELIRSHYLAQFLPDHEYDRTVAHFDCQGVALEAVGRLIVVPGWKPLLSAAGAVEDEDPDSKSRSQILPPLQVSTPVRLQDAQLRALQTKPPKPFTEGDLIQAMKTVAKHVKDPRLAQILKETTGIGTEATRASIIQGLLDREFLIKKGKAVHASDAGVSLVNAVPPSVADPGTTAIWEQALEMIEAGSLSLDEFLNKQGTWITNMIRKYEQTTLNIKVPEGPPCPLCHGKMTQRNGKQGSFWSCMKYPECKGTSQVQGGPSKATSTSTTRRKKAADK